MPNNKILYVGAEAEIHISQYLDIETIQKRRLSKSYRIQEIDSALIASRTREEAKLMMESRAYGVSVPLIYDIDVVQGIITMEYLKGKRIKDILNTLNEEERQLLCIKIGRSIARLHNHDIIHGDITTSNMILLNDQIHFIDFGLGCKDGETEAKGVDLHVLMEAFASTHSRYPQCFQYVIEGYKKEFRGDVNQICEKIEEIVRRGRYRT